MLTEKTMFRGQDTTTINVEVPTLFRDQLVNQHLSEIANGTTSLTFEQWCYGILNLGYNAALYMQLRKVFE